MSRPCENLSYSFSIGIWYSSNDVDLSIGENEEPDSAGTAHDLDIYRLEAASHQSQPVRADRLQHYLWLL